MACGWPVNLLHTLIRGSKGHRDGAQEEAAARRAQSGHRLPSRGETRLKLAAPGESQRRTEKSLPSRRLLDLGTIRRQNWVDDNPTAPCTLLALQAPLSTLLFWPGVAAKRSTAQYLRSQA